MDGPPGSGRWEHETAAGRHDHELRARVVTWPPLRLARLRCERGSEDVVQARWLPKKTWEESWRSSAWIFIAHSRKKASEKYGWLNRIVAVGVGHRFPDGPIYNIAELL